MVDCVVSRGMVNSLLLAAIVLGLVDFVVSSQSDVLLCGIVVSAVSNQGTSHGSLGCWQVEC